MSAAKIMAWPKEDLEARFIKSAKLLHIWGHLTDAEFQKVLIRMARRTRAKKATDGKPQPTE
jgi:hypothetical protein